MTIHEYQERFHQHFPKLNPNKYLDALLVHAANKFTLDTMKLDDWLHEQFGDYESRGLSMREFLAEQFGESTAKFVEEAI